MFGELSPQTLEVFLARNRGSSLFDTSTGLSQLDGQMAVPSCGPCFEHRRDLPLGQKPWMNPMHREATGSAGLHLFQELSTLDQQLTRTPLLGSRLGRIEPMLPACPLRPRQPFGCARSRTSAPVHAAPSIRHCRGLTGLAPACLSATARSAVGIPRRVPIFQPANTESLFIG